LAAGSAPGESGVSVLGVRFRGGAHVDVKAGQHLVCFVSQVHIQCRMAGRANAEHAPTDHWRSALPGSTLLPMPVKASMRLSPRSTPAASRLPPPRIRRLRRD
jgi:hypothetical protein